MVFLVVMYGCESWTIKKAECQRIDAFELCSGLSSLLQHHSSKASIGQHSALFMVQISYAYMTTRDTIALAIQTFIGKVIFLLFNMLSRLVVAFLIRNVF